MIKDKKKGMVIKQKEKIKKGQRNEKERVKGVKDYKEEMMQHNKG